MSLELDYASRSVGDVFFTLRKDDTLNGAVPCDGSEYNASDFSIVSDDYNPYLLCYNKKLPSLSYADYAAQLSKYGCCAYFAINESDGTFKVPTIKNVFIEAGDTSTLAKYMAPGLPNIKGTFFGEASGYYAGVYTGAFKQETGGSQYGGIGKSDSDNLRTVFDASMSNSLYGASSTVQPKALMLRPMIQLVTSAGLVEESEDTDNDSTTTVTPTETLKVPYTFVPGTDANALEVNANFEYICKAIQTNASAPVVYLSGDQTIVGRKTFKDAVDVAGIELIPALNALHGGQIDFHYAGASGDYTARLQEATKGYLSVNQSPPTEDNSTKIATTAWTKAAISASAVTKTTILAAVAPDHNNPVNISSGYTATKYGWINWYVFSGGLYNGKIYINGVVYGVCFNTYGDRTGGGNAFIFVRPGDVVTFGRSTGATFIPCQGV